MLSDFDDIDKHLADPHKLFSNIQSIKELDHSDFLTPRQEEALKHFFEDFSIEGNSRLKEKFLALWNRMDDIYATFNARLKEKGMLYEGALYKDVAEHLAERTDRIPADMTYVFVGFNVLNDVEKRLFSYLQKRGQALFYWDYDVMYVGEKSRFEAGTFIRQNLKEFPNALEETCFDNFKNPPRIEFIATTSENAQARYIPQWLDSASRNRNRTRLSYFDNESCSTGAPFAARCHIAASRETHQHHHGIPHDRHAGVQFINALLSLQTDGYDRDRRCFRAEQEKIVRSHPYAALLEEQDIFCPHAENHALLVYIRSLLEGWLQHSDNKKTGKTTCTASCTTKHSIVPIRSLAASSA